MSWGVLWASQKSHVGRVILHMSQVLCSLSANFCLGEPLVRLLVRVLAMAQLQWLGGVVGCTSACPGLLVQLCLWGGPMKWRHCLAHPITDQCSGSIAAAPSHCGAAAAVVGVAPAGMSENLAWQAKTYLWKRKCDG